MNVGAVDTVVETLLTSRGRDMRNSSFIHHTLTTSNQPVRSDGLPGDDNPLSFQGRLAIVHNPQAL